MKKLLILLLLAGCATEANYKTRVDSWVGQTEIKLVRVWGTPTSEYTVDGHKFLSYAHHGSMMTGDANSMSLVTIGCTTTFEIADGKVVGWQGKGNACVSE